MEDKKNEIINILNSGFGSIFSCKIDDYRIEFCSIMHTQLIEQNSITNTQLIESSFKILEILRKNTKFRFRYKLDPVTIYLIINKSDFEELNVNYINSILNINKFNL